MTPVDQSPSTTNEVPELILSHLTYLPTLAVDELTSTNTKSPLGSGTSDCQLNTQLPVPCVNVVFLVVELYTPTYIVVQLS